MPNLLAKLAAKSQSVQHDTKPTFTPLSTALQAFGQCWYIEPNYAQEAKSRLDATDFAAHAEAYQRMRAVMQSNPDDSEHCAYDLDTASGIATIQVTGVTTKRPTSWGQSCSTILVRQAVRQAARDERVTAIAMIFDTPGGDVSGCDDLAQDIYAIRGVKPIGAYAEDYCCSAGYYAAAQCDFVYCNTNALVGSIGTVCVLEDTSEQAKMLGIRTIVVSNSEFKGAGSNGAPITDAQTADFQRIVDSFAGQFIDSIVKARGVTVKSLQDTKARVYVGQNAVDLGLVDKVATIDQFYAKLGATNGGYEAVDDESDTVDDNPTIDLPEDCDMGAGSARADNLATMPTTAAQNGNKENRNMPEDKPGGFIASFSRMLAKAGRNDEAVAVLSASEDTEDSVVAAMRAKAVSDAGQSPAPNTTHAQSSGGATVSLSARNANERDILAAAHAAGIETSADFNAVHEMSKLGMIYADEVRADAKVQAVRANGAAIGQSLEMQCEKLDIMTVKAMSDSWRAEADKRYGYANSQTTPVQPDGSKTKDGEAPKRVSAAKAIAVNAEREAPSDTSNETAWSQLTEAQQKQFKSMFGNDMAKCEIAAATYLAGSDSNPAEVKAAMKEGK